MSKRAGGPVPSNSKVAVFPFTVVPLLIKWTQHDEIVSACVGKKLKNVVYIINTY